MWRRTMLPTMLLWAIYTLLALPSVDGIAFCRGFVYVGILVFGDAASILRNIRESTMLLQSLL